MKGPASTYGFINAKLRARLSKMIPEETVLKMVRAASFEESIHVLSSSDYAPAVRVYEQTGDFLMAELQIHSVEQDVLFGTERYTRLQCPPPVTAFVDSVLLRFDLENLKNALRLWFERVVRKRSVESKLPYLLRSSGSDRISLEKLVNADSIEDLVRVTSSSTFGPVIEKESATVARDHSLFALEVALDRWYFEVLLSSAGCLNTRDRRVALRLIGLEIDTINVNWIVRRNVFYEGRKQESEMSLISGGLYASVGVLGEALSSGHPVRHLTTLFGDRMGVPSEIPAKEEEDPSRSSSRSLAFLEIMLQQQMLYECRRILGGYPFSIGVVLAYYILVQQEARNLITILNGKYYGMPSQQIEALL